MRGTRHDFKLHRRTHTPHGRSIELDDRLVVAADDQQRRGLHLRQRVACQVWTTAARNHRAYDLWPLGGCDQGCGRTRAGAETGNRQPGHLWMACRPVDGGNDAMAQSIDIKAVFARSARRSRLPDASADRAGGWHNHQSWSTCATDLFRLLKRLLPLPCENTTSPAALTGIVRSPSMSARPAFICTAAG